MNSIDNTEDIIDSRDVIARIAELDPGDNGEGLNTLDEDERDELAALRSLAEVGETNLSDWEYGETLIRDSYFEDYARELADDIGATTGEGYGWPLTFIDWPAAAEALKQDYTELDFDGVTYWARS